MEIKRVFDLLKHYQENNARPDALVAKENGSWKNYSTHEFVDNVNHLSYGLSNIGINKDDKIAIISNNRPEWNFADYASQQSGAISVPIYPTISLHDLIFIFNDAQVKLVFVSSSELYDKVKEAAKQAPSVKFIYSFNEIKDVLHWKELYQNGKNSPVSEKIEQIKSSIKSHDLLTILYTSGTTGTPKGVMLSHNNLLSNSFASQSLAPFEKHWKALSFLPLNHVYERMLNTLYIYLGLGIYYAESLETIGDNLKEVKPQVFATVPRLLEKVYDKIVAKGLEQTGIKKTLFFWALDLGLKYELNGANGWWYEFKLGLANKIIFSKWREALGGNVVAAVSGGAALQPRLARVFNAAKITVLEGYGLTETSPVIAVNSFKPNGIMFGTVGEVIDKVSVKIADDGEILVKGPNVMLGYYNRPDATAEVMDAEGWFHTGDIGTFINNRYLKITDRKKEIFKTSGGKYIAPIMIENKLKESPYIEQALVVGENQKYAGALIVPAFVALKDYCAKHNIEFKSNEDVITKKEIIALIDKAVEESNKTLAPYETIKKVTLMSREWSIEKGEMTPKLSLKRKVILEANKTQVENMFSNT
ncbi:MAG TPA: long-chain fatty acid--CoA ligase [Bacteroidia bacterium]|nr:long-chain fatty acid--CoA ligase [Bacteroidia bacterium]